jgi:hypothetical protein
MTLAALRANSLARGKQPVSPVYPLPQHLCAPQLPPWAAPARSVAAAVCVFKVGQDT